MRQKNRFFLFTVSLVTVLTASAAYLFLSQKHIEVPYAEFIERVKDGDIESVSIGNDSISFRTHDKNNGNNKNDRQKLFKTKNPHSPDLEERLLIQGIEVNVEKSGIEIISLIFDIIFYAFFFVIIFTVFKKFISPNTFHTVRKTGVHFSDIAGMDEIKRNLMQIATLMKTPALAAKNGMRIPRGILLEGDPGNGKTLFARALAQEAGVNFIPAKATDFESMFMAIGPAKVKLLFRKARRAAPCIVFIDEFDGIGTHRNYSGSAIETENTRIVTALLNELDGFTPHEGVLVLAATNSIRALDTALIRPGRFDAKYTVPYPNAKARIALIRMYTKNKTLSAECQEKMLSERFDGFSAAKIESVLNRAALLSSQNGGSEITMQNIHSAIKEM